MLKSSLLCLTLVGVASILLNQYTVEAKPFIKLLLPISGSGSATVSGYSSSDAASSSSSFSTTTSIFPNILAQKLRLFTTLLQSGGGLGFNKFAVVRPTTEATTSTTTYKPEPTTAVNTIFEPETTSKVDAHSTTTASTSIESSTSHHHEVTTTGYGELSTEHPEPTNRPQKPIVTAKPGYEYTTKPSAGHSGYEYTTNGNTNDNDNEIETSDNVSKQYLPAAGH